MVAFGGQTEEQYLGPAGNQSVNQTQSIYSHSALYLVVYACETWTVYQRHAKKLNRFHITCLRKLLRISWRDMVPDTEVLRRTKLRIQTMLAKAQLRWASHVVRMQEERLPKRL